MVCVPPLTSASAVPGPAHPLPAVAERREKQVPGGQLLSKEIHTDTPILEIEIHTAGVRFALGSPQGAQISLGLRLWRPFTA